MQTRIGLAVSLALAAACEPAFDRPPHRVDRARVLAARAEPAEVEPGALTSVSLLAADPGGTLRETPVAFALCRRAREIAESTAVAEACLEPDAPWIDRVARREAGGAAEIRIPEEACAIFGSEPPPAPPGEPPKRPVDPDATGGYYQPVRLELVGEGAVAFARVRLRCALPSAPAEVAREFAERYRPNENPTLLELRASSEEVETGAELSLAARFAGGVREDYVRYDPLEAVLEDRTERLELSWFATAGELADDRSRPPPPQNAARTTWVAPEAPGEVTLWVVLRDDRGGADWAELTLDVR